MTGCAAPERTEWSPLERESMTVRVMEVIMKSTADQAVSLVRSVVAPRGPKAVCEPCPPKAPARSAELPCCRRMMPTMKKETMM